MYLNNVLLLHNGLKLKFLQHFLRLIGHRRNYIFSKISRSLENLKTKSVPFQLDDECGGFLKIVTFVIYKRLERLAEHKGSIHVERCEICVLEIIFLEMITDGNTKIMKRNVLEKVSKMKMTNGLKSLQYFLRLVGHRRNYIKVLSKISGSLENLKTKCVPFLWDDECEALFKIVTFVIAEFIMCGGLFYIKGFQKALKTFN